MAITLVRYKTATREDKSLGLSGFALLLSWRLGVLSLTEARWEWVSGEPVALLHVAFQYLKHRVLLLLKFLVAKFEDVER